MVENKCTNNGSLKCERQRERQCNTCGSSMLNRLLKVPKLHRMRNRHFLEQTSPLWQGWQQHIGMWMPNDFPIQGRDGAPPLSPTKYKE